jgi:hypothetical protein
MFADAIGDGVDTRRIAQIDRHPAGFPKQG